MSTIRSVLLSDSLLPVFQDINEFVSKSLGNYSDDVEATVHELEPKDIFDAVWGTVEFSAAEIVLLDSPIVQRLRRIKQLGLASYVYCNADYSRFSHTLGVVEISGRMARIVSSKTGKEQDDNYDLVEIVRIAALFHDTGHLFLSHASEKLISGELGISGDSPFSKLQSSLIHAISKFNTGTHIASSASLHEIISVMIVNSDAVKKLFRTLGAVLKSDIKSEKRLEQFIEYVSCLILGGPIDKRITPYHTIVNGPFDADKLDYLSRDSRFTSVPIGVDIQRLISKICVVNFPCEDFKRPAVWNDSLAANETLHVMGLKHSARQIFWQLEMAKTTMHESVYYHHKVLTVETMFRFALDRILGSLPPESITTEVLMTLDDSFWDGAYKHILKPEKEKEEMFFEGIRMIESIQKRRLYKRVAAFGEGMLEGDHCIINDFKTSIVEESFSDSSLVFLENLKENYLEMHQLVYGHEPYDIPYFMFVRAKTDRDIAPQLGQTPIESGEKYVMASELFNAEPWMAGRENRLNQHYLVTNQADRRLVYLALEMLMYSYEDGSIIFTQQAYVCSKLTAMALAEQRGELIDSNYYDNDAAVLVIPNVNLGVALTFEGYCLHESPLFKEILGKCGFYQGPNEEKVTEETLQKYLLQFFSAPFPVNDIMHAINGVLSLLHQATYIDRSTASSILTDIFSSLEKEGITKGNICPLGGRLDSANSYTYYLHDLPGKMKKRYPVISSLGAFLNSEAKADNLIFFDDGCYSGKQCISLFQEMMGIPIEKRIIQEAHDVELESCEREVLRGTSLILVFMLFNPASEEQILSHLSELGLSSVKIIYGKSMDSKLLEEETVLVQPEQRSIVKQVLEDIGISLMRGEKTEANGEMKPGWDEDRVKNYSLGYNDSQQLVILERSIPTYSITAFWKNGEYREKPWKSLFARTKKHAAADVE